MVFVRTFDDFSFGPFQKERLLPSSPSIFQGTNCYSFGGGVLPGNLT